MWPKLWPIWRTMTEAVATITQSARRRRQNPGRVPCEGGSGRQGQESVCFYGASCSGALVRSKVPTARRRTSRQREEVDGNERPARVAGGLIEGEPFVTGSLATHGSTAVPLGPGGDMIFYAVNAAAPRKEVVAGRPRPF
ncbi:unnamed protein product [Pylaiella littoralis]